MKLFLRLIILFVVVLFILFLFGSRPASFDVNPIVSYTPARASKLVSQVKNDPVVNDVRPGNEAQLFWADSVGQKTAFALLYLHGFTASHMEGFPVHRAVAKRYGMNIYLPRLFDHGLMSKEPLKDFTAEQYVKSTQEALEIAQHIGEDVIVMGTSTGASAAIYLAAHNPEIIDVLLFFAPNIDVADPRSALLTHPWGKELAELLEGEYLKQGRAGEEFNKYWYPQYRTESAVELMSLLDQTMTEDVFRAVEQPTFISYYFKNEEEKDDIISIEGIHQFYESIGTSSDLKRMETVPDSESHVVICHLTSKNYVMPFNQVCRFLDEVIELPVLDTTDILQTLVEEFN